MMPWDTRPYARSGGERNPSTATVSVTRQKQTHRSYPEHHPYSTATITSATARQTQETEKKFINAYSILYIFTKLLWIKIYCNNISPSGIRRNFRNLKNHIMSKYIIIPIIFTSTIVYGDNQKFNEYAIFCEKNDCHIAELHGWKIHFFTLFRISYYFIYCFKWKSFERFF